MCRLIESICVIDSAIRNLEFHQKRMDESVLKIFGKTNQIDLTEVISEIQIPEKGKFKLRIIYDTEVVDNELVRYNARKIKSFKIVCHNEIEYDSKFENREIFTDLKTGIEEDEIIILKNGKITDTSFSNLIFWDGSDWFTPDTPLLKGTMRASLIQKKEIIETEIKLSDLKKFQSFKLVNSMLSPAESQFYKLSAIRK